MTTGKIKFDDWNTWAKSLGADQPFKQYQPEQLWWPLSTSINEWDHDFHRLMLADRRRMSAYKEAIETAVKKRANHPRHLASKKEPLRVLDIGCGTGILMRFVADAWATLPEEHKSKWAGVRIYGVERDPQIAMSACELLSHRDNPDGNILWRPESKRHSQSGRCAVVLTCRSDVLPQKLRELQSILGDFDTLSLPGDEELAPVFDIIVSETIGGLGDDEDIVRILEHAARALAADNCYIIPQRIQSYIAPVLVPSDGKAGLRMLWETDWRSRVQSINREVYDPSRLLDPRNVIWDTIVPDDYCGPGLPVEDWTFDSDQLRSGKRKLATSYAKAGRFDVDRGPQTPLGAGDQFLGFKGWFVATLFDGTILETLGSITSGKDRTSLDCWKHRFAPVDNPIPTEPGDVIDVVFSREEKPQFDSYSYRWRGRVSRKDRIIDRFDQEYLMKGPSVSPRQPAAPRPLGRRVLDYLLAMLLALLFGLLVEAAIENLGIKRLQQAPQTLLLFALSVNLLRVAHSAFVLAEDRVFHDERIKSRGRPRVLPMPPRWLRISLAWLREYAPVQIWPFLIVALGIVMLFFRESLFEHDQPATILAYAGVCSVLLFFWDFFPWWRFQTYLEAMVQDLDKSEIPERGEKDAVLLGSIMLRQVIIRKVLQAWVLWDISFIVLALLWLFLSFLNIQIDWWMDWWEIIFAELLLLGCAVDWLLRGWFFYFQSPEYETENL